VGFLCFALGLRSKSPFSLSSTGAEQDERTAGKSVDYIADSNDLSFHEWGDHTMGPPAIFSTSPALSPLSLFFDWHRAGRKRIHMPSRRTSFSGVKVFKFGGDTDDL